MGSFKKKQLFSGFICCCLVSTGVFGEKTKWIYSSPYSSKFGTLPNGYIFSIREERNLSIFNILKKDKTPSTWSTQCYIDSSMNSSCLVQSINQETNKRNIGIIISSNGIRINFIPIEETIYQVDKKSPILIQRRDTHDPLIQHELFKNLLDGKSVTYKYKEINKADFNPQSITVDLSGLKENIDFAREIIRRN